MFDARMEELLFAAAFRLAPISVRKCAPPHPISACRRLFRRWQICSAAGIELACVRWSWSTTVGAVLPEQEVEPDPRAPREIPARGCVAVAGRAGQLGTTGEASSRAARCLILGLRVRLAAFIFSELDLLYILFAI
jgi:hypothetical protein